MTTTYTYRHVPGYSAYDHYVDEVIFAAEAEGRKTKSGMQSAVRRAWTAVRPHPATGPRIDVVRADAE